MGRSYLLRLPTPGKWNRPDFSHDFSHYLMPRGIVSAVAMAIRGKERLKENWKY